MVIDTLQLDIIVNTKNSGASITTVRNSLEKLYKTLEDNQNKDFSKVNNDLAKLTSKLAPLINTLNNLNQANKNLSSLSTRLNTFNKNMQSIDAKAMARKFELMTNAITPFINKVMSAQDALVALNGVMSGAKTMTKTAQTPNANKTQTKNVSTTKGVGDNKLTKNLNFGAMVAKLYFVRNITKQLGQDLAKVVQYGIDYEETLNLWQVAMKDNVAQARTFISEMRNAYGISSATLMNYQATFKNMLSALGGINEEVAYGLSEALTGMALDYASLYNTSIESAMTKFQAVLAGQVRPIRSESGYDITESTIFAIYQELGGTKSVRQLDQIEKRLLRILAVYKQMQGTATGDLSKTITSSANQLRIMGEQGKEFATWIGVAFNTMLEKSGILIEINAWLYALTAIAKEFAYSMGYVEKDYSIKEPIEEGVDALGEANKEADELKGKLLGFDKFQVLSKEGVDTGDVDLAAEITKAIQEYERIINDANNPAFERSLGLLKAIGLELDKDGNIVGGFDELMEKVKNVAETLGGLVVLISLIKKPWLLLIGVIDVAYITNEDFRNSVTELFLAISGALSTVLPAFVDLFNTLIPIVTTIIEFVANVIVLLDEMGLLEVAILLVVSALIAWKTVKIVNEIVKFKDSIKPLIAKLGKFTSKLNKTEAAAIGLATAGFLVASNAAKELFSCWDNMSGLDRAIAIFELLAGAAMVAATAIGVFHTSWSVGVAAGVITAGIALIMGYMQSVKSQTLEIGKFADGGTATKGSLFYAGENGAELVTTTSGGNSTIMNMQQLEDAVARGMIRGNMIKQNQQQHVTVKVGSRSLFDIFVDEARSNGYELVKVR